MDDLRWPELHPQLRLSPQRSLDSTHAHRGQNKLRGWGSLTVNWVIGLQLPVPHICRLSSTEGNAAYPSAIWLERTFRDLIHCRNLDRQQGAASPEIPSAFSSLNLPGENAKSITQSTLSQWILLKVR